MMQTTRRRSHRSRPKHARRFLARRLRAVRRERGFSQEELGRRAHLSMKFIGEVERGKKSIAVENLYRIAVALRVPLRVLTDVPHKRQRAARDIASHHLLALVYCRRRRRDRDAALRILEELLR